MCLLEHALPEGVDVAIQVTGIPRCVARPDPGPQVLGKAEPAEVEALEDVGILLHLAEAMRPLVLCIRADLQEHDGMDGDVRGHMAAYPSSQARHFRWGSPDSARRCRTPTRIFSTVFL